MLKSPESDQFNPSLLKHHGKIARGWNHPQTARLLCPMRMSFMEKVKEGQIKITATKLPTFLYDESMFDPAKKSQGCLRGYYLKLLPSTRMLAGGTKAPKGRIHGMTSPLPRAIAYAAVQAYFQLSSANIWYQEIGDFDIVDLYDRVVEMFEGNTNQTWVKETLQHWKIVMRLLDSSNVGNLGPGRIQDLVQMTTTVKMIWMDFLTLKSIPPCREWKQ
ncbi:hypothetical protein BD769DRAFT_1399276 [Suillus cothurnatus]|nr:hypothetical protein BD769DRAFT_1399276 [Suillus cothurnatus]